MTTLLSFIGGGRGGESYCVLNLQYDPHSKVPKSNHSLIVVVIIQMVVKQKNKTMLLFFTTYIT